MPLHHYILYYYTITFAVGMMGWPDTSGKRCQLDTEVSSVPQLGSPRSQPRVYIQNWFCSAVRIFGGGWDRWDTQWDSQLFPAGSHCRGRLELFQNFSQSVLVALLSEMSTPRAQYSSQHFNILTDSKWTKLTKWEILVASRREQ